MLYNIDFYPGLKPNIYWTGQCEELYISQINVYMYVYAHIYLIEGVAIIKYK